MDLSLEWTSYKTGPPGGLDSSLAARQIMIRIRNILPGFTLQKRMLFVFWLGLFMVGVVSMPAMAQSPHAEKYRKQIEKNRRQIENDRRKFNNRERKMEKRRQESQNRPKQAPKSPAPKSSSLTGPCS